MSGLCKSVCTVGLKFGSEEASKCTSVIAGLRAEKVVLYAEDLSYKAGLPGVEFCKLIQLPGEKGL